MRIAIDANAVDHLLDSPAALEVIRTAVQRLGFIFIGNHVVRDQVAATPNAGRRDALLAVYDALPKKDVLTHGGYYGISGYGQARYGDESGTGMSLSHVKTSGQGGAHDALIATTASGEADVLVTDDDQLTKKMRAKGAKCEVQTFQQFLSFIEREMEQLGDSGS
jgi:hypothetical protein